MTKVIEYLGRQANQMSEARFKLGVQEFKTFSVFLFSFTVAFQTLNQINYKKGLV